MTAPDNEPPDVSTPVPPPPTSRRVRGRMQAELAAQVAVARTCVAAIENARPSDRLVDHHRRTLQRLGAEVEPSSSSPPQ